MRASSSPSGGCWLCRGHLPHNPPAAHAQVLIGAQPGAHLLRRCSTPRCRSRQWPPTGCRLQDWRSRTASFHQGEDGNELPCNAECVHGRLTCQMNAWSDLGTPNPPASMVMPSGTALCPLGLWTTARPSSLPSGPRRGMPCRTGTRDCALGGSVCRRAAPTRGLQRSVPLRLHPNPSRAADGASTSGHHWHAL